MSQDEIETILNYQIQIAMLSISYRKLQIEGYIVIIKDKERVRGQRKNQFKMNNIKKKDGQRGEQIDRDKSRHGNIGRDSVQIDR